jgi:enoyl-CoA hydratase/carnithine racemase
VLPPSNSFIRKAIRCQEKYWKNWHNKIHGAGNDEDTKVILLRSDGDKAFCAGASLMN